MLCLEQAELSLPSVTKHESEADAAWYGYVDCDKCGNDVTMLKYNDDGSNYVVECECSEIRVNFARLDASGIRESLESLTFDNFRADEDWQKNIKHDVMNYCASSQNSYGADWLFLGGQVGSGKTHLGTAALGYFVEKCSVKYMLAR